MADKVLCLCSADCCCIWFAATMTTTPASLFMVGLRLCAVFLLLGLFCSIVSLRGVVALFGEIVIPFVGLLPSRKDVVPYFNGLLNLLSSV
ncbi:hypothetical protein Scep_026773 [Stephania cephalantha]|uniref:Transmembrane protein n=1 Tax=Stephania cephalantha TaxID=152367 RepID=A0AAP0EUQ1_9MAGN